MKLDWVAKVQRDMELGKAMALQEWAMPTHERPCQFVTVKECASLLRVSERTIRRLIRSGELPAYRLHRLIRIKWADVWDMLDAATLFGFFRSAEAALPATQEELDDAQ